MRQFHFIKDRAKITLGRIYVCTPNFFNFLSIKVSPTYSQVMTSRCSQKAPTSPPHMGHMGSLMATNALTGSPLGVDRCAIQKKNWPLGWRLIMEKMQESLSKRSSSSTGQMVAAHLAAQNKANKLAGCVVGRGPRTLRFDLQMNCQPRERRCSLVASC